MFLSIFERFIVEIVDFDATFMFSAVSLIQRFGDLSVSAANMAGAMWIQNELQLHTSKRNRSWSFVPSSCWLGTACKQSVVIYQLIQLA